MRGPKPTAGAFARTAAACLMCARAVKRCARRSSAPIPRSIASNGRMASAAVISAGRRGKEKPDIDERDTSGTPMHPVLRLYEDFLSSAENVEFQLPPLPRFIFVVHGSATIGGETVNEGASWQGEGATLVRPGKGGGTRGGWGGSAGESGAKGTPPLHPPTHG